MRIINQWHFENEAWGIALFCVFGGRFHYGFVICGFVFEWSRPEEALRAANQIIDKWDSEPQFVPREKA